MAQDAAILAASVQSLQGLVRELLGRVSALEAAPAQGGGGDEAEDAQIRIGLPIGGIGGGDFLGVRVGSRPEPFLLADFTGTPSDYAKVFYDAVTAPEYTDEATRLGPWTSDFVVIKISDVSGYYILPRG